MAAADDVAVEAVEAAVGPDVDVVAGAADPVADVAAAATVVVLPDVGDRVAVAAAAGPDAVAVAVAVAAAAAAPRAVSLPIACNLSHNTRCQCDEETDYMLGTHGHPSAKPR